MSEKKYNIGYIDEDEICQATARQKLSADFNVVLIDVPFKLEDIWEFVLDNELDALIVDFRLFESGQVPYDGTQVVSEVKKHNEHFPMFIMTSYENDAVEKSDNVLIIRGKEILRDREQLDKFVVVLKASINSYKKKVESAKMTILNIEDKLSKGEILTAAEDAERFKAQLFLIETDKDESFPKNLASLGYSSQLKNVLDKTDELLEKLSNK